MVKLNYIAFGICLSDCWNLSTWIFQFAEQCAAFQAQHIQQEQLLVPYKTDHKFGGSHRDRNVFIVILPNSLQWEKLQLKYCDIEQQFFKFRKQWV